MDHFEPYLQILSGFKRTKIKCQQLHAQHTLHTWHLLSVFYIISIVIYYSFQIEDWEVSRQ